MRTIKFRGKHIKSNEWLYGNLICPESMVNAFIRFDGYNAQVVPETVGQFTGLLDCNGKEIYEGDILADVNGFIRKVAFVEDAASPMLIWLNDEDIDSPMPIFGSFIKKYGYRVIGNIHDNPELLNNSK